MISITCQRAAELVSQSMETPLSGWERLALGIHVGICGPCWRYRRQSALVQRAGRDERAERMAGSLSEAARERIKRRLRLENPDRPV